MGITQGRILLPSLNLRFGATPMVSIVTWVMFPEELAPTAEEGELLALGYCRAEPLEFEPNPSSRLAP